MARARKAGDGPQGLSLLDDEAAQTGQVLAAMPAYHREHPDKLNGEALRNLAHKQGLARSTLASMPDDKIRMELRYLAYRRADAAD